MLSGQVPSEWRRSVYYRYYHQPGHHNTQAHYGVRTERHKLIYYWNKDAYEMFDLQTDPNEQVNLLSPDAASLPEETKELFESLKSELKRLQEQYGDEGEFASPEDWPKGGVDGQGQEIRGLGKRSVEEAFGLTQ